MKEYGFTACERGVVDACDGEVIMNDSILIIVIFFFVIGFILKLALFPKDKTERFILLKREVKKFHGLCGIEYEYKTIYGVDCVFLDGYISDGWREYG